MASKPDWLSRPVEQDLTISHRVLAAIMLSMILVGIVVMLDIVTQIDRLGGLTWLFVR